MILNNKFKQEELLSLLEQKYRLYCREDFIVEDPVSIPKRFHLQEDIEVSALLTALISWGRRPAIIKSASNLMEMMDNQPFAFVTEASPNQLKRLESFVYRTFNASDLLFLIAALKEVYLKQGGLQSVASEAWQKNGDIKSVIMAIRSSLLTSDHLPRSEKHLANPDQGSAAKRINMFLRWMVRTSTEGVDFGIWNQIPASALICPLDVHSGNVARQLGLLARKQNDWKAAEELTANLRLFDPHDPVKFDFALFGMGVYE
jgi:uncharacterized protein (TIGR02757 family)